MPLFPSEEWFVAVKNQYNENPDLHSGGGGACDTLAGLEIADRFYRIEFAGHECWMKRVTWTSFASVPSLMVAD